MSVSVEYEAKIKKFEQQLDRIEKKMRGTADSAKKSTKKVQKSFLSTGKIVDATTSQVLKLGATFAGLAAIKNIIGGAIDVIKEFEKGLDELSAITGVVGKDLNTLKKEAIAIGKATTVSASEAVTAFKLMASAKPELLKSTDVLISVTKEAIALSEASGIDLPMAISILGNTLNALNLPASEAGRVVNVLTAAAKKGAKETDFVSFALSKFGGVAESAGIQIETSAAAIEILGAKIPQAETVGVGLRNVIIELQTAAQAQGREFEGLSSELDRLSPRVDDITFLEKQFGKENILVAQTLIKQRDELDTLEEAITDTSIAYEQQRINTNNLDAATRRLDNQYEAFILSLDSGEGFIAATVKGVINLASGFLSLITPMSKTSDEMREQQLEMNILVSRITDTNIKEEERRQLIIKLNKEYPELLKNLDEEKVSNEDLAKALKTRNEETFKLIAFEQEKENLLPKVLKRLEAENKLKDERRRLDRFIARVALDLGVADQLANKTLEEKLELIRKEAGFLGQGIQIRADITKAEKELTLAQKNEAAALADVRKIIVALNITREEANEIIDEGSESTEDSTEATLNNIKAILDQIAELKNQRKTAELGSQAFKDLDDEIARLNALLPKTTKGTKKATDAFTQLQDQISKLKREIQLEALAQKDSTETTAQLTEATAKLEKAQEALNIALGKEPEALKNIREDRLKGEKDNLEIVEREAKALQGLREDELKDVADNEEEKISIRIIALKDLLKINLENQNFTGSEIKRITKDTEKEITRIKKEEADKQDEKDKETAEKRKARQRELVNFSIDTAIQLAQTLFTIRSERLRNENILLDNQQRKEQQALEARGLSGERFQEEQGKLDDKFAEQRNKLKTQEAVNAKNEALFSIIVSTAAGVAKAIAAIPLTVGLPFSALVAAAGAIQFGIVASRPIPEFWKGTKGASEGLAMIGERGPELQYTPKGAKIVPSHTTKRYSDLIDSMVDNKLDDYINQHYVLPALQEAQKTIFKSTGQRMADGLFMQHGFNDKRILRQQKKQSEILTGIYQNTKPDIRSNRNTWN